MLHDSCIAVKQFIVLYLPFNYNYILPHCSHYVVLHAIWSLQYNDCLGQYRREKTSVSSLMLLAFDSSKALSRVQFDNTYQLIIVTSTYSFISVIIFRFK